MSKETGGAAFPIPHTIIDANHEHFKIGTDGLTIRDYFAGEALGVLIGGLKNVKSPADPQEFESFCVEIRKTIAKGAYEYADAMLAERSKP